LKKFFVLKLRTPNPCKKDFCFTATRIAEQKKESNLVWKYRQLGINLFNSCFSFQVSLRHSHLGDLTKC
jgi:hypothetical protein